MKQFKKGDMVRYHPIIGEPHDGQIYTCRSDVFSLGHGEKVIQLEGKSGCVSLEAISLVENINEIRIEKAIAQIMKWAEYGMLDRKELEILLNDLVYSSEQLPKGGNNG